jgi:hypothetical protein
VSDNERDDATLRTSILDGVRTAQERRVNTVRDHGYPTDPTRGCEAPVLSGDRCKNPALRQGRLASNHRGWIVVNRPYCYHHLSLSRRPDQLPEPGYVWEPLMDLANDCPYYWFQLRTPEATRRALALNRNGRVFAGSSRARDAVWKYLKRRGLA